MNHNQKRQLERKSGINPVAMGIAGAVVGATVAVAGAVILSDDKKRQRVTDLVDTIKESVLGYVEKVQDQAEETKDEIESKAGKIVKDIKKDLK